MQPLILQGWIHPGDKAIEWGSGRSTLWFVKRIVRLVSIEHSYVWYEKVRFQLKKSGLADKMDYHLLPLTDEVGAPPNSSMRKRPYADAVNDSPDESFDFALMDGKMRHVCTEKVLPKICLCGIIILDNSERYIPADAQGTYIQSRKREIQASAEWKGLLSRLNRWRTIGTTNGVRRTRLWIKPF